MKGNGFAAGQSKTDSTTADSTTEKGETTQDSETQYGATGGDASATAAPDATGDHSPSQSVHATDTTDANNGLGENYGQAGGSAEGNSSAASGDQVAANSGSVGSAANSSSSAGGKGATGQASSIAESHGRNWAVQAGGRSSVPIRRPIEVVVRKNQIALLPSRHALDGDASTGKVISLNQPIDQISNEFRTALRTRIEEWGLAGSGLYWRPMLKLNVGPGAEQTAEQVMRLLKDSGVEIRLPNTARVPNGGTKNAPR